MVRVVVAGYFDPLHEGHIQLFEFAYTLGIVTAITHPYEHSIMKSGFYIWNTETKLTVLKSCCWLENVVLCKANEYVTICETLKELMPKIYVVGHEYQGKPIPEQKVLDEIGCKVVYNPVPRMNGSRDIKKNILIQLKERTSEKVGIS